MAITKNEGSGGKISRQARWRVRSTPYDSPPSAARGMCRPPQVNQAGGSGWFKRLLDPATRVIGRIVSCFFSSVLGLAATSGESISAIEEVPEVKTTLEVREQGGNSIEIRLSVHYDGSDTSKQELISHVDAIFHLEQLLNQQKFSRVEIDKIEELLHSSTVAPSTSPLAYYKNMEKLSEDSCISRSSSHQVLTKEKEKRLNASVKEQMVNGYRNVTSEVNVNQGFDSPTEIARANLASKPRKALGGRSRLYEMTRSPNWKSTIMKNARKNSPYNGINVEPLGTFKWSKSPSTIGHFGHGQVVFDRALKRSSSDMDEGCFTDARNVRQKSYSMDFCRLTHIDASPSIFF